METPFTARNAVKFVVRAAIHGRTAQLTENVITDHTRFEEDDFVVETSSHLVGWYVSSKLKPVTDKMVDRTADYIAAKRSKKDAPKDPQ